jgi:2-polyprenyl-3-methyl-5-hydroxy-6-metoxy-1,4-benzoquinol methylase
LQPGVESILTTLRPDIRLLDLGCGNGELAQSLAQRGFTGRYLGFDFSAEFLVNAKKSLVTTHPSGDKPNPLFTFLQADLSSPTWDASLPPEPFDVITAFAVLHHLPGAGLRQRLLAQAHSHLAPGGNLIHSEWQFQHSPRLAAHILPWETIDLTSGDVDPGDTLLDWRQGGRSLRYVHLFTETELAELAAAAGFTISETFYSDGQTGDLGLYQVWAA